VPVESGSLMGGSTALILIALTVGLVLLLVVVLALLVQLMVQLRQARREAQDLRETLRHELTVQARADREEAAQSSDRLSSQLTQSVSALARLQTGQIEGFSRRIEQLTQSNESRLNDVRSTLETRLEALSRDNAQQLARMRETVDEKLQNTLEHRLGESFARVAGQLEQMHRGLGEMQALATDVGDLKRVLTNVKTRGTWGEVQLGSLLSQVLAPAQFSTQVITVPGSNDRVEFAVCLPGSQGATVWLPIDAKFPKEDWERLQQAHDRADAAAAEQAHRALEQRVRTEARRIRDKYLAPPHTTDFGLLFLPTEGLYAEVARRPGLLDDLQRESRIIVTGPTTLAALLNSLQMGFRTLAVEQRTSEVWMLLGAVRTEFSRFGEVLARTRAQLRSVGNSLDAAEVRSRAIERQLRQVESVPETQARALLPEEGEPLPPSEPR